MLSAYQRIEKKKFIPINKSADFNASFPLMDNFSERSEYEVE